jgi:hypothetical protein
VDDGWADDETLTVVIALSTSDLAKQQTALSFEVIT